jgi:acylphosphatase
MLKRVTANFSGRVQGVGFRATTRQLAMGFELVGTVKNLVDGRVEVVLEGEEQELLDFLEAMTQSHLGSFIHEKEVHWTEASGRMKGFSILPT